MVEVPWRTSSYTGGNGGNCVEVADRPGIILVRDTKNREGLTLPVPSAAWVRFTESLK